jgi:mRNA interferase RelE/StbE
MNIVYSKQATKAISRMDSAIKKRVRDGIEGIPEGDIKALQGFTDGRQRLRIGKFRIIFTTNDEDLNVLDIGSRGDIYK